MTDKKDNDEGTEPSAVTPDTDQAKDAGEAFVVPESDNIESGVPFHETAHPAHAQEASENGAHDGGRLTPQGFNDRMKAAQHKANEAIENRTTAKADAHGGGLFSSVTIRTKLLGSLSLLTLIIIVLGAVSYLSLSQMNEISSHVTDEQAALARVTEEIKATVFRARGAEAEFLLKEEQAALDQSTRFLAKLRGQIGKAAEIGEVIAQTSGERVASQYVSLSDTVDKYESQFAQEVKNVRDARATLDAEARSAAKAQQDLVDQATAIGGAVRTLVDDYWVDARRLSREATSNAQTAFDKNNQKIAEAKGVADALLAKQVAEAKNLDEKAALEKAATAATEAAEMTASAASDAATVAFRETQKESARIVTALEEGVLLVDLGRSMQNAETQIARYLQVNDLLLSEAGVFADAAIQDLKDAANTAEHIRQASSDLALSQKMKDAVRDIEILSKTFSKVVAHTGEVERERVIVDKEIAEQKAELLRTGEELLSFATELSDNSWNEVGSMSLMLRNTGADAQTQLLIVALAGVFVGIFVVLIIPRPITAGLAQLLGAAQRVAGGDLTQQVRINSRDELGQLAGSFEQMRQNLMALVERIQAASTQITTTVNEIQAAANQQSSSANEQSSALTQFSGTMSELAQTAESLSNTTLTMSENADFVAGRMGDSSASSRKTLASMQAIIEATRQTSERIKSLNDQMDGISTAVDTISSIADQTTLLSLNAAIEANKAGEMGEGFAVVATEIRRLSDRSIDSAATIRNMVRDIQRATESSVISMDKSSEEIRIGIEMVEETSESMDSLNGQIVSIREQTQDISTSSSEQSQVSREAKATTEQMMSSATLSAEAARQTSSATYELTSMSAQLSDAVSAFKLS